MKKPILYIFSGLPGVGKSTLAKKLAKHLKATYLRIDTIEQTLLNQCGHNKVVGEGYSIAYSIAQDNLKLGQNVIADSVNPIGLTREAWIKVATSSNADYVNIEIICSSDSIHQKRVEHRNPEIQGHILPTWQEVTSRKYDPWDTKRLIIDTAIASIDECLQLLITKIESKVF